jgi:hypothetical protein
MALLTSSALIARAVHSLHNAIDASKIRSNLSVKKVVDTTLGRMYIDISYPRDTLSNEIVNTVCNVYVKWKQEIDLQSINHGLKIIEDKIRNNQTSIDSLEHYLKSRYSHHVHDERLTLDEKYIRNRLQALFWTERIDKETYERLKIARESYDSDLYIVDHAE